jgi:hypothetical protein
MMIEFHAGQEIITEYPFVKEEIQGHLINVNTDFVSVWIPSVKYEIISEFEEGFFCDGLGKRIITVHAVFKPGKFRTRVFYTQKWQDPEGKIFGSNKLRIMAVQFFRDRSGPFKFPYEVKTK